MLTQTNVNSIAEENGRNITYICFFADMKSISVSNPIALTLLHSERSKLYTILIFPSAIGLK